MASRVALPNPSGSPRPEHPTETVFSSVVVCPLGRLEGERVSLFRRRMALLSVVPGADVVVDMAGVSAMDEGAAQALADAGSRLRRTGGHLQLLRMRPAVRQQLLGIQPPMSAMSARMPRASGW